MVSARDVLRILESLRANLGDIDYTEKAIEYALKQTGMSADDVYTKCEALIVFTNCVDEPE